MRISVVIPALNEAGNIGRLVQDTFAQVPPDCLAEVIVVDDASEDVTGAEVKALIASGGYPGCATCATGSAAARAPRCARASLRRRARSSRRWMATARTTRATYRGSSQGLPLRAAAGRLVNGWRTARRAEGRKRLASKAANWIRDAVLKDDCPDTGCGIKVYWREAFLRLPYFTTMHRYLPALFRTYGHEVAHVPGQPATPGRRLEIQQRRPRAGRALRPRRRELVAPAHARAGDRGGSARGTAAGGPHQPSAAARSAAAIRR